MCKQTHTLFRSKQTTCLAEKVKTNSSLERYCNATHTAAVAGSDDYVAYTALLKLTNSSPAMRWIWRLTWAIRQQKTFTIRIGTASVKLVLVHTCSRTHSCSYSLVYVRLTHSGCLHDQSGRRYADWFSLTTLSQWRRRLSSGCAASLSTTRKHSLVFFLLLKHIDCIEVVHCLNLVKNSNVFWRHHITLSNQSTLKFRQSTTRIN